MPLSSRKEVIKFVHRKLLFRLRRLTLFFLIIIGIVIYELSQSYIAGYLAAFGFFLGMMIGLFAGRHMQTISWDAEANKAVTKMDRLGIFILVVYLLFAFTRRWIFSHWLNGYALTAFSLSVGAGGILGRLYTLRQQIRQVLKEEGFLHPPKDKEL